MQCNSTPSTPPDKKTKKERASTIHNYCFFACSFSNFAFFLATSLCLFISASAPTPPKTRPTPSHCILERLCPNANTEKIIDSIFRVTVTVTRTREPNLERVWTGD